MRDIINFDVVIVGAGPAGLSAAIQLKKHKTDLSVCILEKGAEVGAHIMSGAVIETRALNELIPDWQDKGAPIKVKARDDHFLFLTKNKYFALPTPPQMKNHDNYIVSLSNFCKWLAEQARAIGVEIFPSFVASEILYENDVVVGVVTGDMGIAKNGSKRNSFQPGIEIRAKHTLFAEGCRGHLTELILDKYNLRNDPQTYAIGIKEIWEIDGNKHKEGSVVHTVGWPLNNKAYGGSFIYHLDANKIAIGFVVGLDYQNPYLDPYMEFQEFKSHPYVKKILENGKRIAYGARALNEGGLQSIPKLNFPGGCIIGCAAGFLNVAKIKGTHNAMKSGMLAADAIIAGDINSYEQNLKNSWVYEELYKVRNIRPSFEKGLLIGLAYSAIDTYIFRGKAPWTFRNKHDDASKTKLAKECRPIIYKKPDNKITFDRVFSLSLSGTNHEENQPCHLHVQNKITNSMELYDAPEQRFCPAGVYEYVLNSQGNKTLQINAQNCLHCKTCDIKCIDRSINWTPPEAGGGPRYSNM